MSVNTEPWKQIKKLIPWVDCEKFMTASVFPTLGRYLQVMQPYKL